MTPEIKEYLQNVPSAMRSNFLKAIEGKCGLSLAVKMQCYQCFAYNKAEVAKCDITTCPLYQFNPYRKKLIKRTSPASDKPRRMPQNLCDARKTALLARKSSKMGECEGRVKTTVNPPDIEGQMFLV